MTTALTELTQVRTPKGNTAFFEVRTDTSDGPLVGGIVGEDEYGLKDLPNLTGWAIDIGAHIGTVAVALALDHPDLRIVAVEALPENVEQLRANVSLNGLRDRIEVVEGAATNRMFTDMTIPITYGWSRADNQPDGYMHDNRYIGGMVGANETSTTINCPAVSLRQIMEGHRIREVDLLKIDCEGCEWFVLDTPQVADCRLIWGEFHVGRNGDAARLRSLLELTHDVEMDDSKNVGLFRATRR